MEVENKEKYRAPRAEVFLLNPTLCVLDKLSMHMGWDDFVDGDDEDQY